MRQIAEALQDIADYRKTSQHYMLDGTPDPQSKDNARNYIAKAWSIRQSGPKS